MLITTTATTNHVLPSTVHVFQKLTRFPHSDKSRLSRFADCRLGEVSAEHPLRPRCSSDKHVPTSDSTAKSGSLVHQFASSLDRAGEGVGKREHTDWVQVREDGGQTQRWLSYLQLRDVERYRLTLHTRGMVANGCT